MSIMVFLLNSWQESYEKDTSCKLYFIIAHFLWLGKEKPIVKMHKNKAQYLVKWAVVFMVKKIHFTN